MGPFERGLEALYILVFQKFLAIVAVYVCMLTYNIQEHKYSSCFCQFCDSQMVIRRLLQFNETSHYIIRLRKNNRKLLSLVGGDSESSFENTCVICTHIYFQHKYSYADTRSKYVCGRSVLYFDLGIDTFMTYLSNKLHIMSVWGRIQNNVYFCNSTS